MKNPLLIFLSSIDHHGRIGSFSLSNLYSKMGIYKLMCPYPFEHYCVFCRRFTDDWWDNTKRYDCPKCGHPLEHIRFFNEEIFGTGEKNPFIGWVCRNEKCHGWYCDYCEEWHPYGTMCGVAAVHNSRDRFCQCAICDPNWKHREKDLK